MHLTKQYEKIEALKGKMLQKVAAKSKSEQHAKPSEGKWSEMQVLIHLIEAETGVIAYINKKTADTGKLQNATLGNWIKSRLLVILLSLPLKFKAPKVLKEPSNEISLDAATKQWIKNSADFKEIIARMDKLEDKIVFKHPVAGYFNLSQTFDFIYNHMQHHYGQLK